MVRSILFKANIGASELIDLERGTGGPIGELSGLDSAVRFLLYALIDVSFTPPLNPAGGPVMVCLFYFVAGESASLYDF